MINTDGDFGSCGKGKVAEDGDLPESFRSGCTRNTRATVIREYGELLNIGFSITVFNSIVIFLSKFVKKYFCKGVNLWNKRKSSLPAEE